MSKLLIVESPSKAKTINKYLGTDFHVLASYGHVRDLLPKAGAIDTTTFEMNYALIDRNKKHMDAIINAAKTADQIFLATDPDREGEAISWHIIEILKQKKITADNKEIKRVVFEEITKDAIKGAIASPRDISMPLVNAQQARRALDYLVGFNLSPLLWKKIRRGLSAGRVQSPALRLICEREDEIDKFIQQEYWSIHLEANKKNKNFPARLIQLDNKKLEQFSITSHEQQEKIVGEIILKSSGKAKISRVDKKNRTRYPAPPFTTSTLQQEAVRKLGFTTNRTMRTAQQLYEGIAIKEGTVGLITYMRTDSLSLSNEAVNQIRGYIKSNFEDDYLPKNSIGYKTKSKNAQEAHEAIRPTDIKRTPESVRSYLSPEQFKLYEIIWKRSVACQMAPAIFDAVSIDLEVGKGETIFRSTGQTLKFPGFISVYLEDEDDAPNEEQNAQKIPELEIGDVIDINKIFGQQHFTEPPPRYSEASLVKTLEEYGIGRPSTYASIISTLQDREYALLDKKRFTPTDVGRVVNKFLTEHFSQYVDYDFTANLESDLDNIAANTKEWKPVLDSFWKDFNLQINEKENIDRAEITQEAINEDCPKCGKPLFSRLGRRGKFIGCSAYPDCDYTRNIGGDGNENEPKSIFTDSDSGEDVFLLNGPYGPYLQIGMPKEDDKKNKPKRISIPPNIPLASVNEEIARKLMSLPITIGEYPGTGKLMIANIGRFGPYISHDGKFKSIPKSDNIFDLSFDRSVELVAELIEKNKPLRIIEFNNDDKSKIEVLKGRWGAFLQRGKTKAPLSQKYDYATLSFEEADELIKNKEEREKNSKKKKKK